MIQLDRGFCEPALVALEQVFFMLENYTFDGIFTVREHTDMATGRYCLVPIFHDIMFLELIQPRLCTTLAEQEQMDPRDRFPFVVTGSGSEVSPLVVD